MPQVLESTTNRHTLAIAANVAQSLAANAVERDRTAGLPEQEVQILKQSGLLKLSIPQAYGGWGADWPTVYQVIQAIATADGSVGQMYANHATLVTLGQVLGRPGQADHYYRQSAEQNLFWANALNARDARLKISADGACFRAHGVKSFGTGMAVADLRVVAALQEGVDMPIVFILPQDRTGITYNEDWANMGQRRTVSGSYTFNQVLVTPDEILGPPSVPPTSAFPTLLFLVAQLAKVYVYLGIAEGALQSAKDYTTTQTRPWLTAGVESATQDPYILHTYGELWTQLQAAIALADQAAWKVQAGWERGADLTFEERGEIAVATSAAKAFATRAGLDVTQRMFEVMGARATASRHGFDRYWRDLRTFTLHDPVAYKYQAVGDWWLTGTYPLPSQYS